MCFNISVTVTFDDVTLFALFRIFNRIEADGNTMILICVFSEISWFFFFVWKQGTGWIRGGGQTVRRKSVFIQVGGDGSIERWLAWRGTYLSELNSRMLLTDSMNGRRGEKRWRREKIVGHGKKPEAKNPERLQATISQWALLWKLMCLEPAAKSLIVCLSSEVHTIQTCQRARRGIWWRIGH